MSYNFTTSLSMNPIRVMTGGEPFHYSVEARPHEDHIANTQILINAIEELRTALNTQLVRPSGSARTPRETGQTGATGAAGESAPVLGMLIWPSGMTLPNTNWIVCSGQELDISSYPLVEPLGSTFGTPSEAGKVKLPDNTGNAIPNTILIMRVKNDVV